MDYVPIHGELIAVTVNLFKVAGTNWRYTTIFDLTDINVMLYKANNVPQKKPNDLIISFIGWFRQSSSSPFTSLIIFLHPSKQTTLIGPDVLKMLT